MNTSAWSSPPPFAKSESFFLHLIRRRKDRSVRREYALRVLAEVVRRAPVAVRDRNRSVVLERLGIRLESEWIGGVGLVHWNLLGLRVVRREGVGGGEGGVGIGVAGVSFVVKWRSWLVEGCHLSLSKQTLNFLTPSSIFFALLAAK